MGTWNAFINSQLMADGHVKHAAILGLDGEIWAKTDAFDLSSDESVQFATNYTDVSHFYANGIVIGKTKFFFLSGTDRVMRGKKSKEGIHCIKTESCIIIATYEEPVTPGHVANIVESCGEYLISLGS